MVKNLLEMALFEITMPKIYSQNYGHNIMRIADVLPNFPFTTSEAKPD